MTGKANVWSAPQQDDGQDARLVSLHPYKVNWKTPAWLEAQENDGRDERLVNRRHL